MLVHLAELGIRPGVELSVAARAPYDEPITLAVAAEERVIGAVVARRVLVAPTNTTVHG